MPGAEKVQTEQLILDAALAVFCDKGLGGARTQEIADRAGVNKALLHYYFRSKERLFEEVVRDGFRKFVESLTPLEDPDLTFADFLKEFIDRTIDYHNQHPESCKLVMRTSSSEEHSIPLMHPSKSPSELFSRKVKTGIKNGEIREVDPLQTFMTVIGSCLHAVMSYKIACSFHPAFAADPDAYIASRKKNIYDLIHTGLVTRT